MVRWTSVIDMVTSAVTVAFGWLWQILETAPGAYKSIFSVFVILAICRFLLSPLLGVAFGGRGSDRARKRKENNDG